MINSTTTNAYYILMTSKSSKYSMSINLEECPLDALPFFSYLFTLLSYIYSHLL